jgi:hypothetical protein
MLLSEHRRYAPALVAVRTGLEHHLADRLLFLANRYLQVYPVKKAGVAAEEMRLAALQAGPRPDIARWGMNDGRMNVVVRGLYPTGSLGRGATLSPYYFVGDEYDPFTGRPKNIHRLSTRLDAERQLLHSYSRGNVAELARRPRLTRIAEPSYTDELKPRGR